MNCLFCGIAAGRIPSENVFESDEIVAFRDINPQAPVHILVIPKSHMDGVGVVDGTQVGLLGRLILTAIEISRSEGLTEDGFRLVVNEGRDGGQTVDHLHLHLLGGRQLGWPPG